MVMVFVSDNCHLLFADLIAAAEVVALPEEVVAAVVVERIRRGR